ncbi:MAG TPA: MerR family transcriptional regulator [Sphingobium sp.]|uniref:MerR family transcriptional regulator n=1 Tax=Sphingobium sp. TaxID=1912891 RepID=UPI002ED5EA38
MSMTISELARAGGVGVETVRFYQRKGLLPRPGGVGQSGAGIRHYGTEDVRRLRFIRSAQTAGFALKEITRLLELDGGEDRPEVRVLARARVAALDEQIAALREARDALDRLATECERSRKGPCPILNAFEAA